MNKVSTRASVFAFTVVSAIMFGAPVFALSADPTNGAAASLATTITDYLTDYAIPAIITVVGVSLIVTLLLKVAKKIKSAI